ncbi:MAG: hypothetical protein ACI9QD_000991, partial [Thermoproteota archaeon]
PDYVELILVDVELTSSVDGEEVDKDIVICRADLKEDGTFALLIDQALLAETYDLNRYFVQIHAVKSSSSHIHNNKLITLAISSLSTNDTTVINNESTIVSQLQKEELKKRMRSNPEEKINLRDTLKEIKELITPIAIANVISKVLQREEPAVELINNRDFIASLVKGFEPKGLIELVKAQVLDPKSDLVAERKQLEESGMSIATYECDMKYELNKDLLTGNKEKPVDTVEISRCSTVLEDSGVSSLFAYDRSISIRNIQKAHNKLLDSKTVLELIANANEELQVSIAVNKKMSFLGDSSPYYIDIGKNFTGALTSFIENLKSYQNDFVAKKEAESDIIAVEKVVAEKEASQNEAESDIIAVEKVVAEKEAAEENVSSFKYIEAAELSSDSTSVIFRMGMYNELGFAYIKLLNAYHGSVAYSFSDLLKEIESNYNHISSVPHIKIAYQLLGFTYEGPKFLDEFNSLGLSEAFNDPKTKSLYEELSNNSQKLSEQLQESEDLNKFKELDSFKYSFVLIEEIRKRQKQVKLFASLSAKQKMAMVYQMFSDEISYEANKDLSWKSYIETLQNNIENIWSVFKENQDMQEYMKGYKVEGKSLYSYGLNDVSQKIEELIDVTYKYESIQTTSESSQYAELNTMLKTLIGYTPADFDKIMAK